jgi:hypothetical protein
LPLWSFSTRPPIAERIARLETSTPRPRLRAAVTGLHLEENGRVIPHNWCVMEKSAGEPDLEVADFMMHTIASYCRGGRDPQAKFAARFSAIFGTIDERSTSFMESESVTCAPQ